MPDKRIGSWIRVTSPNTSWGKGMFNPLKVLFKIFHESREPVPSFYLGHRGNMIYHRDDCEYGRMMRRGRRLLRSQNQAVNEGFRPCKICQPDRNPYSQGEWVPDVWT